MKTSLPASADIARGLRRAHRLRSAEAHRLLGLLGALLRRAVSRRGARRLGPARRV